MASLTPKIGLKKLDLQDHVNRTIFNEDMNILDNKVGGVIDGQAAAETRIDDLETEISNKASSESVTAIETRIDAAEAAIDVLEAQGSVIDDTKVAANKTWSSQKIKDMVETIDLLPPGGTTGQVLAKKSDADGDVQWQNSAGIQGTFGGEFSTKADLLAFSSPQIGFNYIVTADETQGGARTYYTYIVGGTYQYMGSFSDGSTNTGGGSGGGYSRQWNSPADVVAGNEKVLVIPYTASFVLVQPTILKFISGIQNVVTTVSEFDNGAASSFEYNSNRVEFIGSGTGTGSQMHLKTIYEQTFTLVGALDSVGQYSTCSVNLSAFKTIEKVEVI